MLDVFFSFLEKGCSLHFRNGRQLTSLQFAWPFYESDPTNQAEVPLRPFRMGHMYGKESLLHPRRTMFILGGCFREV